MLAWIATFAKALFVALIVWLLEYMWGFFTYLIDQLVLLWAALASWALSLLPMDARAYLQSTPWQTIADYLGPVTWLIPVNAILVVLCTALSFVVAIRFGRWCLSFVPAINGG